MVDLEPPEPRDGELRLRVLAAGVCRTDLALLRSGPPAGPVTLGHEIVGEVDGRPVAVYELIGCGRCAACARGEDNLCRSGPPEVPGVTRDGGMAEQVVVPARNVVELGDLDPAAAAPLTDAGMTALHAVERARRWLTADATAAVIGIGGLGHLAVQFIVATSAARVVAVDVDRRRIDLARELGAAGGGLIGEDALEDCRPVDVVLDFVGSQQTLDLAAGATARGGAIVVVGGGGGKLCITAAMGAGRIPDREVTMIHTFGGGRRDLAKALELAAAGRVTTHVQRFALEDAGRALEALDAGRVLGRAVIVP